MSKGLGRTERAILELLVRHGCHPETVSQFAGDIELGLWKGEDWPPDFTPSPSSIRSVERALRSLERKGLVVRIEKPFKSYERGRPPDGWLVPAQAAEWHARNRRPQREPPPAKTSLSKTGISDEELAKVVEKVRSMRAAERPGSGARPDPPADRRQAGSETIDHRQLA